LGVAGFAVQRQVEKLREAGTLDGECGRGLVVAKPDPKAIAAEKRAHPLIRVRTNERKPLTKSNGKLL